MNYRRIQDTLDQWSSKKSVSFEQLRQLIDTWVSISKEITFKRQKHVYEQIPSYKRIIDGTYKLAGTLKNLRQTVCEFNILNILGLG